MGSLLALQWLFSSPVLTRVEVRITSYPKDIIAKSADLKKIKDPRALTLDDYLFRVFAAGRDFEALDESSIDRLIVVFLIDPRKTSLDRIKQSAAEGGMTIEVISTNPVRGKLGYYKF